MIYINPKTIKYFSKRYNKWVIVEQGFESDGASGPAIDICSNSWFIHDKVCDTKKFDDGTNCSNIQASFILYDILKSEGRHIRKYTWFVSTYLWGQLRNLFHF